MEMKKCIYIVLLISSFFSCKKITDNNNYQTDKENVHVSEYKQVKYIDKDISDKIKIFKFKDKETTIEYADFTLFGLAGNNKFNVYKSNYDLDSGELDLLRFDYLNQNIYLVSLDDYAYKTYHAYSVENDFVHYLGEIHFDLGQEIEKIKDPKVSFQISRNDNDINIKQFINDKFHHSNSFAIKKSLLIYKSYSDIDEYINGKSLTEKKIPLNSNEEFFNVQILDEKISVKTKSDKKVLSNSELLKVNTNCPQAEVDIVQKDNYFTIEKYNCDNTYYFKEYVTFKYLNGLFLYKYDVEYTDRRDPDKEIPTKKMTVKNFGEMKFEDVTDYFLLTLRQDK